MPRVKHEPFSPITLSEAELHILGVYIDFAIEAESTIASFNAPVTPEKRRTADFINKVIAPQLPRGSYESVAAFISDLHLEVLN